VPYIERSKQVLARAVAPARLRETEPETAKAVDAWLAASGTKESDVRALMLRTRFAWIAVLVDPKTAQPIKYILGERIE
jgi:cytochrome P450